jgi:hypothetical protein
MVRKGWSWAALALVALVVAGAIQASVGGGSDEVATTAAQDAVAPAVDSGAGAAGSAGKSELAQVAPPSGGGPAVVPGSPRVVRTADLRVKVAEGGFGAAFDRVASIAAAGGGFVSSSTTASVDDARSGELTVRVPADRFDSVRQTLAGLGEVESQSIRGEDVSGQLVDFEARLTSLQAQEDALRVLVGQAKAVGDVLQVQSSLFSVRQQIEQLKAQKANLEQTVALATIQVSLFEPGAPALSRPDGDDRSLARSFERALDGMVAVVGGMIVVVGYLVPVVALGLVVWVGSRIFRRRPAQPAPQAPAI